MPGRAAGGRGSLRLRAGKALFFRREAQTFCLEEPPAGVGVCAPKPGKPYPTVERRKPCAWKSGRRAWEFAPQSRESLNPPLWGANLLPGKAAGGRGSLRPRAGKALFHRREAQTFCLEKRAAGVGVCAPEPGKPYSSVEGRKPCAGKSRRLEQSRGIFTRRISYAWNFGGDSRFLSEIRNLA